MKSAFTSRFPIYWFALAMASLLGAAMRPVPAQCPDSGHQVTLNGKSVRSEGLVTLSELLSRHLSRARLGPPTASLEIGPAVLIDGILASAGLEAIASLPVQDVDSVVVLRPRDAVTRVGSLGVHGAIVVATRKGVAQFDRASGSCPPRRP